MPYQKTKEGRLVNEVTLGDGYPLSNDKQPLKVGGEASIINVSSPTPDGSVDGEVEVKGKLKAKDTIIQGDLKVFSDSDTYPQFVLQSKAGTQCQLRVQAAANSASYVRLQNNQGYWKINKPSSNTKLNFTNDTNTPLTLDGDNVEFTNLTDGSITIDSFVDEDNMSSNSATKIPTQQSVKAYVDNEVAGLVDSAPATLDTLNELAAALNDDANFATTVTNSIATKVGLTGNETIAGIKTFSSPITIHTATDAILNFKSSDDSWSYMQFLQNDGDRIGYIGFDGDQDRLIINATENGANEIEINTTTVDMNANVDISGDLTVDTSTLKVDSSNNRVGIGTTSPTYTLDVAGNIGVDQFIHHNDDDNTAINFTTDTIKLQTDGTTGFTLDSNQNVGIGTTSPDATLEVNGAVHIEGGTYVNTNETKDDAALVLEENFNIYVAESGYLRNLISKENDVITLGQAPTNFIDEIRLIPGTSGFVSIYDGDGTTETIRLQGDGNVGIGNTSPNHLLHVGDDATATFVTNPDKAIQLSSTTNDEEIAYILYSAEGTNNIRSKYFIDDDIQWVGWDSTFSTGLFGYKWQIAGNDKMALTTAGNLGIGTTSPDTLLHLASSSGDVQLKIEADTDNDNELDNPQVLFAQDGGAVTGGIGLDGSNNMRIENIWSNDAADVVFHASNAEKMRITGTGNVGIGTTSPIAPLHIESNNNALADTDEPENYHLLLRNPANDTNEGTGLAFLTSAATDDVGASLIYKRTGSQAKGELQFYVKTNDTGDGVITQAMTIDDSANVGIGTTSPTTTLDVEGTVSYKHISLTDSSDDLDVSGCTVVECTPSGTDTLGGLTGGVQGQILYILKVDSGLGRIIIEHNEGTGNQDIFLSGGSDVMLSSRGGITLYCNGTSWFALDK